MLIHLRPGLGVCYFVGRRSLEQTAIFLKEQQQQQTQQLSRRLIYS